MIDKIYLFWLRLKNGHYNIHLWLILMFVLLLMCSCGTTKTIVDTQYRYVRDTIRIENIKTDTLQTKDSVLVFMKGDTVLIKEKQIVYRNKTNDDIRVQVRDSIVYVDREVEKVVPSIPKWYSRFCGFAILLALVLGMILGYHNKKE